MYRYLELSPLAKFVNDHELEADKRLASILKDQEQLAQVIVDSGTLTFPSIKQKITLIGGKSIEVMFDLDPGMLYASSLEDVKRERQNRIGEQLKAARKRVGITQEELARRVGTSKGYISRIENNRSDIELSTLRRIVEVGLEKRLAITD